jgi:hypothetical protein
MAVSACLSTGAGGSDDEGMVTIAAVANPQM